MIEDVNMPMLFLAGISAIITAMVVIHK